MPLFPAASVLHPPSVRQKSEPPPSSAAVRPVAAVRLLLRMPHRAGDGGRWAACRQRPLYPCKCAAAGGADARPLAGRADGRMGEGGAALPYLTKGNVATETPENTETEGNDMDTDGLHSDDYEEYNRRTIDYGNGRIEIAAYHSPRLRYIGSGRTPSGKGVETSDDAQEARTRQQIYAIRRKIKGYALCNSFRWFVTLTFDPEKVKSSDYETAKSTLLKWCRKMRDRHGQFSYLLIPELHKSGAVHFHGLLGNVPADFVEAANPKTGKPVIRHNRQVYNLTEWEYGFSDCEEIESPERAASYITKYVTTALLTDKEMYNKKRYFNSQGLAKPDVTFSMNDNSDLEVFIPNFGVIETDEDGRNVIETGIYNLTADPETGALSQTDTDYLITAKTECHISRVYENSSLGDAKI